MRQFARHCPGAQFAQARLAADRRVRTCRPATPLQRLSTHGAGVPQLNMLTPTCSSTSTSRCCSSSARALNHLQWFGFFDRSAARIAARMAQAFFPSEGCTDKVIDKSQQGAGCSKTHQINGTGPPFRTHPVRCFWQRNEQSVSLTPSNAFVNAQRDRPAPPQDGPTSYKLQRHQAQDIPGELKANWLSASGSELID